MPTIAATVTGSTATTLTVSPSTATTAGSGLATGTSTIVDGAPSSITTADIVQSVTASPKAPGTRRLENGSVIAVSAPNAVTESSTTTFSTSAVNLAVVSDADTASGTTTTLQPSILYTDTGGNDLATVVADVTASVSDPLTIVGLDDGTSVTATTSVSGTPLDGDRIIPGGTLGEAETSTATGRPLEVLGDPIVRGALSSGPSIFDRFPVVMPKTETTFEDEEHQFRVVERQDNSTITQTTYTLDKAPFKHIEQVVATVNGRSVELAQGTDFVVIDEDGDGQPDTIDFDVGGLTPDDNSYFTVTYRGEPVLGRYASAYDYVLSNETQRLEYVLDSFQVDNATGNDLDQIGALFGRIGKRRDRDDDEYRELLQSIVESFGGRGTVDGMEFALAAGLGVDKSDVTIVEDFSTNTYYVQVANYDETTTSRRIKRLADLVDPSGIDYDGPIGYEAGGGEVVVESSGASQTN